MKGIVLCAGRGTRVRPFTFSLPKTLLPVMNRPLLDHAIDQLLAAGIHEIGVVTHPSQGAITDHLASVSRHRNIEVLVQTEPLGIAHALHSVRTFVGKEPFVLLLGDNLLAEPLHTLVQSAEGGQSSVLLKRVSNPQEYGVASVEQGRLVKLEEKPSKPQSDLAVMGAYLLQPAIFEAIHAIQPSARGEYEITDAIQWLIDQGHPVTYTETQLPCFDVGTYDRWLEANAWMLAQQGRGHVSIGRNTRVAECVFRGNVLVGDDCVLENAVIGPNVTLQDGCVVRNCTMENSILMTGATVKTCQCVSGSILGRGAVLEVGGQRDGMICCALGDKSICRMGGSEVGLDGK